MLESDRPHVLREMIYVCRPAGVLSIPGVYGGLIDKVPFGALMNKGLTIRTGQTHVNRWTDDLLRRIEERPDRPVLRHHPHASGWSRARRCTRPSATRRTAASRSCSSHEPEPTMTDSSSDTKTSTRLPRLDRDSAPAVARGLGWYSIALGVAELLLPELIARATGTRGHEDAAARLRHARDRHRRRHPGLGRPAALAVGARRRRCARRGHARLAAAGRQSAHDEHRRHAGGGGGRRRARPGLRPRARRPPGTGAYRRLQRAQRLGRVRRTQCAAPRSTTS